MYTSLLNVPASALAGFDQLRRELDQWFGHPAQATPIRSTAPGAWPALNVGTTASSIEVFAFAPGLDPARIDVTLDRGVLTLAGERVGDAPAAGNPAASVYARERPVGAFKRAISLPDDADPSQVRATYRDGVLRISIARKQTARPTRVTVQ